MTSLFKKVEKDKDLDKDLDKRKGKGMKAIITVINDDGKIIEEKKVIRANQEKIESDGGVLIKKALFAFTITELLTDWFDDEKHTYTDKAPEWVEIKR